MDTGQISGKLVSLQQSHGFTAKTGAGMLALWNPRRFAAIVDYESWEALLLKDEDLRRHIGDGQLVPVNLGIDGAFRFAVRISEEGEAVLAAQEACRLEAASAPYLLVSEGEICLSGIEHVGGSAGPERIHLMPLKPGRYQVVVHILAWEDDPDSRDADGRPARNALPDFLVLVSPEKIPAPAYRLKLRTFDPPGL